MGRAATGTLGLTERQAGRPAEGAAHERGAGGQLGQRAREHGRGLGRALHKPPSLSHAGKENVQPLGEELT